MQNCGHFSKIQQEFKNITRKKIIKLKMWWGRKNTLRTMSFYVFFSFSTYEKNIEGIGTSPAG